MFTESFLKIGALNLEFKGLDRYNDVERLCNDGGVRVPDKTQNIQWHPAFVGGIELALRRYKMELTFESEHNLSKKPLQMDMLIIKKNLETVIDTNIGRIFKAHNVLEYKNPKDGLNIDDFYKVIAYACLYKSLAPSVNEIPGNEISVSLFRDKRPVKMFRELKKLGFEVTEKYKGVYYVSGVLGMPTQVIVTSELDDADSVGLRILSDNPKEEDLLAFAEISKTLKDKDDRENADAVLQVSVSANKAVYDEMKRRYPEMCEALRELMRPEIDAEIEKEADKREETTTLKNIQNLMKTLKMTAEQAMDALLIPAKEQSKYLAKL